MPFHLYVETCDRISVDFCNSLKLWLFFITYQTNSVEANLVAHPRILIWKFVTYILIICVCGCVFFGRISTHTYFYESFKFIWTTLSIGLKKFQHYIPLKHFFEWFYIIVIS